MIKKAVLLTTLTPFLMVFSLFAHSDYLFSTGGSSYIYQTPAEACSSVYGSGAAKVNSSFATCVMVCPPHLAVPGGGLCQIDNVRTRSCSSTDPLCPSSELYAAILQDMSVLPSKTDEQCQSDVGSTVRITPSQANTLNAGGTLSTAGGACSVSRSPNPQAAFCYGDPIMCDVDIVTASTNDYGYWNTDSSDGGQGTFSVLNFSANEYLEALPGGCSDASSCVTIGDTSYLVDWSKAPDHFSYVGSDGNTYSNPNAGGGSDGGDTGGGDPTDPTNPTDPTDPGGNDGGDSGGDSGGSDGGNDSGDGSGGSSGGGSSGGGSSVPDFEFDDSSIIEAIRSSGQSNQNALEAVSNDLSGAINSQSEGISEGLEALGEGFGDAIGEQTEEVQGMFDGLGNTITNALGLGTCYPDGQQTDDGHTAATNDKGLLGCIQNIANGMVDNLVGRLTEEVGEGNDLLNTSGMDETLDGLEEERQLYNEEVNTFMDEIGDGSSSGIAEQVTSRLPSLPSRSCTPIQFGQMQISCQATNTAKLWLTWIVYFWTVVSVVDTFFRSGQRTA